MSRKEEFIQIAEEARDKELCFFYTLCTKEFERTKVFTFTHIVEYDNVDWIILNIQVDFDASLKMYSDCNEVSITDFGIVTNCSTIGDVSSKLKSEAMILKEGVKYE